MIFVIVELFQEIYTSFEPDICLTLYIRGMINDEDDSTAGCILLYTNKHIETFLDSRIINEIVFCGNIEVLKTSAKLNGIQNLVRAEKILPEINKHIGKFFTLIALIELWRNRYNSFNLKIRALNQLGTDSQRKEWSSAIDYGGENIPRWKRVFVRVVAKNPFYFFTYVFVFIIRNLYIKRLWTPALHKKKFILIPYSGHNNNIFENITWIGKKLGIKVIALQENWDNVSSKNIIKIEPDIFAVWGRQSEFHLKIIHNLKSTKISVTGSPRFNGYYNGEKLPPMAVSNFTGEVNLQGKRFILLAGTGDGKEDELVISETLKAITYTIDPPKIVYRPHPNTRFRHDLSLICSNYPEILLDEGVQARSFGHQVPLVQNSVLIISLFSTMLLEGLLNNKFVCAPIFLDQRSKINWEYVAEGFPHYTGMSLIRNFFMPKTKSEYVDCLTNALESEPVSSGLNLDWICEKLDYSKEISKIISEL